MPGTARVEQARDHEREAAFGLLFGELARDERRRRVANALNLIDTRELDPGGIFVVRDRHELLGVIVCLRVPGASALVWPPRVAVDRNQLELEDQLVRHAVDWVRRGGVKLAQCLLSPEEVPLAAPLERNGFAHITHLWQFENRLDPTVCEVPSEPRLEHQSYSDAPALFHETLLRTYENTLDCPEIAGVRSLEEIIEGHRAQGEVPPGGWTLALANRVPVGILMMVEISGNKSWEIAYLGIVPEARRLGYGRGLVRRAICMARKAGAGQLNLSVDGRNSPAWDLYRQVGFQPVDRREVYLASWR